MKQLRVTALGGGPGSFLLEMGGVRMLINPVLSDSSAITPENAHEMADFVILTTAKKEHFDEATIGRMKLMKVDFLVADSVTESLGSMMVRNMATLASGPDGRTMLSVSDDTTSVAVLVCPSANGLPWETPELGFIFVNLETGQAVGYEAQGLYLGENAATVRQGIPDEAYQVDHIITPDLRKAAGVAKGLTGKGAILRSVVRLPEFGTKPVKEADGVLGALLTIDKTLDSALGSIDDDPKEFREFLQKQGNPLAKTQLLEPSVGGPPVNL